jgi:hypothetical protein
MVHHKKTKLMTVGNVSIGYIRGVSKLKREIYQMYGHVRPATIPPDKGTDEEIMNFEFLDVGDWKMRFDDTGIYMFIIGCITSCIWGSHSLGYKRGWCGINRSMSRFTNSPNSMI